MGLVGMHFYQLNNQTAVRERAHPPPALTFPPLRSSYQSLISALQDSTSYRQMHNLLQRAQNEKKKSVCVLSV